MFHYFKALVLNSTAFLQNRLTPWRLSPVIPLNPGGNTHLWCLDTTHGGQDVQGVHGIPALGSLTGTLWASGGSDGEVSAWTRRPAGSIPVRMIPGEGKDNHPGSVLENPMQQRSLVGYIVLSKEPRHAKQPHSAPHMSESPSGSCEVPFKAETGLTQHFSGKPDGNSGKKARLYVFKITADRLQLQIKRRYS